MSVLPVVQAIQAGYVTATIDQQAYLQGFDTIMQLFLWNVSGGLMRPTDTDTGIGIVTKSNVTPYLTPEPVRGDVRDEEVHRAAVLDIGLVFRERDSDAPTSTAAAPEAQPPGQRRGSSR